MTAGVIKDEPNLDGGSACSASTAASRTGSLCGASAPAANAPATARWCDLSEEVLQELANATPAIPPRSPRGGARQLFGDPCDLEAPSTPARRSRRRRHKSSGAGCNQGAVAEDADGLERSPAAAEKSPSQLVIFTTARSPPISSPKRSNVTLCDLGFELGPGVVRGDVAIASPTPKGTPSAVSGTMGSVPLPMSSSCSSPCQARAGRFGMVESTLPMTSGSPLSGDASERSPAAAAWPGSPVSMPPCSPGSASPFGNGLMAPPPTPYYGDASQHNCPSPFHMGLQMGYDGSCYTGNGHGGMVRAPPLPASLAGPLHGDQLQNSLAMATFQAYR
eukprot:TRINITY_DN19146_c0_g1_i1.p1 TRINITY_DN19146_c0_g1~~TRINITY_DN19146_c0_g1_i1.p1  ORF type:complete len:334 (-),score=42.12 TRINITY_DN19146_c0_g1_i1:302-1303(-)